ncbi:DUF2927 domain-containing protein [Nisaea acidiphila]|uniref:DUF2927 domain-containing protein n=1 Tax=Nisaea acidiphila TaxID=1862145 RepID=A0A9J7AUR5_9PROT|nr:DUF2927 domain-containing protein [Nisaea acidiphila]UUX51072.1 DUF2927 domain-containing protein [Nisaea acidiphila]
MLNKISEDNRVKRSVFLRILPPFVFIAIAFGFSRIENLAFAGYNKIYEVTTNEIYFMGVDRKKYVDHINKYSIKDVEVYFKEIILRKESEFESEPDGAWKRFDQVNYVILNNSKANIDRVNYIRSIMKGLSEITNLRILEVKRKPYSSWEGVDIAIYINNVSQNITLIQHYDKTRHKIYDSTLRSGEYCFAVIGVDDGARGLSVSTIGLVDKVRDQSFKSCALEEIIQVFGLTNDMNGLDGSVLNFEDNIEKYGAIDLLLLRLLYNKKIQSGSSWIDIKENIEIIFDEELNWFEMCFYKRICD